MTSMPLSVVVAARPSNRTTQDTPPDLGTATPHEHLKKYVSPAVELDDSGG